MKIAIDARMVNMSGIGKVLQECLKRNIYDIALGNADDIRYYNKDIEMIPFKEKIYGIKEQFKYPLRQLYKYKPDILHIPHYNVPIFYTGKLIVTINDLTHVVLPELLPNKYAFFYAKVMYWIAAHKATHIITISQNTKEDIVKRLHVKPKKVSVVYLATDKQFCKKNEKEYEYLYGKYKIDYDCKIILYVGNLKPHKNLPKLLEAMNRLKYNGPIILFLVGKVFDSVNITDIKKDYGLDDNIIITGIVSNQELVDLYNIADVFVFTSLYEGFGLPPLEAMACGTPVVCSNNSSLPEVVGDAALTFNPYNVDEIANSIDKVLSDKELSNQLVLKGLERVKNFSWDKATDEFRDILLHDYY